MSGKEGTGVEVFWKEGSDMKVPRTLGRTEEKELEKACGVVWSARTRTACFAFINWIIMNKILRA